MKIKLSFLILLILATIIKAQMMEPKWENVFESTELTVYIDTTTIKQYENQISVLSISIYKKPQMIASLNEEAESVKSQLLFNAASKKYTIIGSLYYDKNSKILGQTSLPGFTSGSEKFALPIEADEAMTAVFNKTLEYLKNNKAVIEEKTVAKESEKTTTINQIERKNRINDLLSKVETKDNPKTVDRVSMYLTKKDSMQKAEILKQANSKQIDEKTKTYESGKTQNERNDSKSSVTKYESKKEKNPKGMIFSDGDKYCFQVSSWKIKSQAEREVNKLKRNGHNAFITEGLVRRRTWYRVRIGYFNSVEETESYMKKLR